MSALRGGRGGDDRKSAIYESLRQDIMIGESEHAPESRACVARRARRELLRIAMSRERFIERQKQVREAAARLAEAATQPETDIARDATIKRFEFTFEVAWKTLRLFLDADARK